MLLAYYDHGFAFDVYFFVLLKELLHAAEMTKDRIHQIWNPCGVPGA